MKERRAFPTQILQLATLNNLDEQETRSSTSSYTRDHACHAIFLSVSFFLLVRLEARYPLPHSTLSGLSQPRGTMQINKKI